MDLVLKQNNNSANSIYYVKIDPKKISHISLLGEHPSFSGPGAICGTFGGCFDLLKKPFKRDFMYHTVEQLLDGVAWESTAYFKKLSKYKSREEAFKHLKKLDKLIKILSEDGYQSQYELGRANIQRRIAKWVVPRHEILIGMDRKGQFFRIKNGRHRLAVAQHIGIPKMPAILVCYHKKAVNFLPPDRKKITTKVGDRAFANKSEQVMYLGG